MAFHLKARRLGSVAIVVATVLALTVFSGAGPAAAAAARQATTPPTASCSGSPSTGTSTPMPTGMAGMGTPAATVEFDQVYIDMMLYHHAAVIAMAQAALPRLTDNQLKTIAQDIITTQGPEREELRSYRQRFYGSPDPMPMAELMAAMHQEMPGMPVTQAQMAMEMDPAAEVAAFCAAKDPNLAFIDLTIPHHESAVAASEAAQDRAVHPEIKQFARNVIAGQEHEIYELRAIRQARYGAATATP